MESGEKIMNLKAVVENYVSARLKLDQIMIDKKEAEAEIAELTEEIVGFMEMNPIASLESTNGYKLSKGTKRSSDIVDWSALKEWADVEGDDYIRERWGLLQQNHKMSGVKHGIFTEQPNRRLMTVLLQHYANLAEQTGRDMNDLLPPGLKQRTTTYLIMRRPTKKDKDEALQGVGDTLLDMARRGAMENE
jgi:hypothetical protein